MEKRLGVKCNNYIKDYKYDIKKFIDNSEIELSQEDYQQLIQYIFDYDTLSITKEDFIKRKRVKNIVPFHERCCALRANNEQCTRRKRDGSEFCGTHIKGTPHGVIKENNETSVTYKKNNVWTQDIKGIMYHIDDSGNVYKAEDVMKNTPNPNIIAKYTTKYKDGELEYILSNYK